MNFSIKLLLIFSLVNSISFCSEKQNNASLSRTIPVDLSFVVTLRNRSLCKKPGINLELWSYYDRYGSRDGLVKFNYSKSDSDTNVVVELDKDEKGQLIKANWSSVRDWLLKKGYTTAGFVFEKPKDKCRSQMSFSRGRSGFMPLKMNSNGELFSGSELLPIRITAFIE